MSIDPAHSIRLLLLATILLLAVMAAPRLIRRWPLWARLLTRVGLFVALTVLVQAIMGSPLQPRFALLPMGERFWAQLVEASWWIAGAGAVIGLLRLFVVLEHRPRETRIVSDLLAGAVVVAAGLAVVNFAFAVPIRGLLATSGVIAIVLGLALQSTLSDVFSGIAVGLERPYKAGDLIWVEGGIEGHVIQVNWRSTQIATGHDNVAVVPNSVIAKARLVNRSTPSPVRGVTVALVLDAAVSPERCVAVLTAAIRSCSVMRATPAPGVACIALAGDGGHYEIGFSIETSAVLGAARTELLEQVHRHLRHAGIALAVPGLAVLPALSPPDLDALLESSDLFGVIDPEDRGHLASFFSPHWLKPNETLIRQGDTPDAMFLIASGSADVSIERPSGVEVVHRMGPGESLGAIGLITGQPYAATATATTPLKAFRISRGDIAAAIKEKPDMATALEALARRGQDALRHDVAHEETEPVRPDMFLARLRNFLHVLAT